MTDWGRVLAGAVGGGAQGALDYDEGVKKDARIDRQNDAVAKREMALAKYRAGSAADLQANRLASSEKIAGEGTAARTATADADRVSREATAAAGIKSTETGRATQIKAAREAMKYEYELKGELLKTKSGKTLTAKDVVEIAADLDPMFVPEDMTPIQYTISLFRGAQEELSGKKTKPSGGGGGGPLDQDLLNKNIAKLKAAKKEVVDRRGLDTSKPVKPGFYPGSQPGALDDTTTGYPINRGTEYPEEGILEN